MAADRHTAKPPGEQNKTFSGFVGIKSRALVGGSENPQKFNAFGLAAGGVSPYIINLLNFRVMATIKKTTKKGVYFLASYNRSTAYELRDYYGRYSCAKACAENECRDKMRRQSGRGFKILSFNTFGFSCGWLLPDGSLQVETPTNSYNII